MLTAAVCFPLLLIKTQKREMDKRGVGRIPGNSMFTQQIFKTLDCFLEALFSLGIALAHLLRDRSCELCFLSQYLLRDQLTRPHVVDRLVPLFEKNTEARRRVATRVCLGQPL